MNNYISSSTILYVSYHQHKQILLYTSIILMMLLTNTQNNKHVLPIEQRIEWTCITGNVDCSLDYEDMTEWSFNVSNALFIIRHNRCWVQLFVNVNNRFLPVKYDRKLQQHEFVFVRIYVDIFIFLVHRRNCQVQLVDMFIFNRTLICWLVLTCWWSACVNKR
jgi:hypothetical protein